MASIKKSEARLLVIFGILIFGTITFFVLEVISGRKNDEVVKQRAYQNKIREYQDLISQREQWEVKREFVERYQPVYRTEEQEAPALEAYFRSAAQSEAIEIKTLRPMPPEPLGDNMMAISLEAKVSGAGSDVLRFLIQLQAENRFYAIPSITIASDRKDPTQVSVDMIFSRWFALDGQEPVPDDAEAPPAEVASAEEDDGRTPEPNRPLPAAGTGGSGASLGQPGKSGAQPAAPDERLAPAATTEADTGEATTAADEPAAEDPPSAGEPEPAPPSPAGSETAAEPESGEN